MWSWLRIWRRPRNGGAGEAAQVAKQQLNDAHDRQQRVEDITRAGQEAMRRTDAFTRAAEQALRRGRA